MIDGLISLADELATRRDADEVMLRRAAATAYYAAFHALCQMVASALVGEEDRTLYVRVYRKTQHNHLDASRRLFDVSENTRAVRTSLDASDSVASKQTMTLIRFPIRNRQLSISSRNHPASFK